jgi:hypothetical protein
LGDLGCGITAVHIERRPGSRFGAFVLLIFHREKGKGVDIVELLL